MASLSFQLKGYVRLAIYTRRSNKMTSSSLIGAPWQQLSVHASHLLASRVYILYSCLHIMVIVFKDFWRLEADLMHVGTAMSVKFDTTHQSCCCCEPLNLEHISLTPSPHAVGPLPFKVSTCNIESGQREATITFYCHCLLVQLMPCNAPRILCSREL